MNIPVILHVRTNIDWRTMTEESFLRQEDVSNSARGMSEEQKERFLDAIRLWNSVFGLSYFDYRQRLKEIAELSWTRIRNLDAIVRVPGLMSALDALERYIVLPVDDDDWFHPDVAEVLRQCWTAKVDALHWPETFYRAVPSQDRFGAPGHSARLIYRDWEPAFGTNAYALTRAGLSKCDAPLKASVLSHHLAASRTYYGAGFERVFIKRPLSVSNKSLASCTNLNCLTDAEALVQNVPHLLKRTTDIPAPFAWAADYIARAEQLDGELCHAGGGRPPTNRLQRLNYLARTRGSESYLEIGFDGNRATLARVVAERGAPPDASRFSAASAPRKVAARKACL